MKKRLVELESDHPGFADPDYRRRRDEIARIALTHEPGTPPARVEYTDREDETWRQVYTRLSELFPTHACQEYNKARELLGYTPDALPQLADVSAVLTEASGFRLEPVHGLIEARDFLVSLGQGVFCATQYIRHHSRPHYTPEPDVVHELVGHAPMLAIPEFAELSRRVGEGAVHATDEEVEQLVRLYWYTVEFGLVRQDGELKAYGAGLLSSYGELRHALSGEVEVRELDPEEARKRPYPITTYQPLLWEVPSIAAAFERMDGFVRSLGS